MDRRGGVVLVVEPGAVVDTAALEAEGFVVERVEAQPVLGEALAAISRVRERLPRPRFVVAVDTGLGRIAAGALPGFAGAVDFGGELVLPGVDDARPVQPLDLLPGLGCPYQAHVAADDPATPAHHVAELERRLRFVAQPSQVLRYPAAGAGFWRTDPLAWARTLRFLDNLAP